MATSRFGPGVLSAQAAERGFVRLFGGYTVGLAGGTLLVNERLPFPRFNFVQLVRVAAERQSGFFEAALDHYFQRGLRPEFRVALPVPSHVEEALEKLSFRPVAPEEEWLVAGPDRPHPVPAATSAGPVPEERWEELIDLWIGATGRAEFRRCLEVGRSRPNPGERLEVFGTQSVDGALRCVGLPYRRGPCLDLEAVITPPSRRGAGAATEWVVAALASPLAQGAAHVALRSTEPRLAGRLAPLGFEVALRCRRFELPADAALALRAPAPSSGPRWRPPRLA